MIASYLNKSVSLVVSGTSRSYTGVLVDIGSDVLVVRKGGKFLYVPLVHMQRLTRSSERSEDCGAPPEPPLDPTTKLSYRKVLLSAKGMFSEIEVVGNRAVHGYVTSIMNDFFVFYSPMYRSLYVNMRHLKTLIPYDPQTTPYAMEQEKFPINPMPTSLARTFDQQLKKFEGEFVVLDLGEHPGKIGLLKSVKDSLIELVAADGYSVFIHLDHVKTIHRP